MDLIDKRDEVLRLFLEYGITENTENDLTKTDLAECAEQIVEKLIIGGVGNSAFKDELLRKTESMIWFAREYYNKEYYEGVLYAMRNLQVHIKKIHKKRCCKSDSELLSVAWKALEWAGFTRGEEFTDDDIQEMLNA